MNLAATAFVALTQHVTRLAWRWLMNLSEHLVSWGISDGGACMRVSGENKWLELPICSPSSAQASQAKTSSEDELARRGSDSSKVGERPDALRRLPDCYHCAPTVVGWGGSGENCVASMPARFNELG